MMFGPSKTFINVPFHYQHEKYYHALLLQASHYSVIVNDCNLLTSTHKNPLSVAKKKTEN